MWCIITGHDREVDKGAATIEIQSKKFRIKSKKEEAKKQLKEM